MNIEQQRVEFLQSVMELVIQNGRHQVSREDVMKLYSPFVSQTLEETASGFPVGGTLSFGEEALMEQANKLGLICVEVEEQNSYQFTPKHPGAKMLNEKLDIPGSPEERRQFIKTDLFQNNIAVNHALTAHYRGMLNWEETMEYLVCYLANENKKLQEQILDLLHNRPPSDQS